MTYIIGISAFYHDSAAALIEDGNIVLAVQEERFTRIKHDFSFPTNSIEYILKRQNISINDVDYICFYEKPFLKFERLLETYVAMAPRGFSSFSKAMPEWLRDKLFQKNLLINEIKNFSKDFDIKKLLFSEHHYSHAASAFFPSPYKEAVVLTMDGVGEWATSTISIGNGNKLEIIKEINFPHSLGLLYSAFTYYLGFKVNSGEYKVMGLAPYGEDKYKDIILKNLIDIKLDGSFRLNQKYFNYATGLTMTNEKFDKLFGQKVRNSKKADLTQFHMDIAASLQSVTEEILLKIITNLSENYKVDNLCLAGGVALNCVANGKIYKTGCFKNIWIQPAAGDAGGALGAALATWYTNLEKPRIINTRDSMKGSYLGPNFTNNEIKNSFDKLSAVYREMNEDDAINFIVNELVNEKAIGWFQGAMEFGPRALGGRSIIADPRSINMQKKLNLKVKFRESFRPFAPSILREKSSEWFDLDCDSPYMLLVGHLNNDRRIKMTKEEQSLFGINKLNIKRSSVPAITHVDYSARIQTVTKDFNPRYYKLLKAFDNYTQCPILVNTSFNIRGEPIVHSPEDAFRCFMGTNLDVLICENIILLKEDQDMDLTQNYKDQFELD